MKKKVLFALIALFSFVSTWAADPNPSYVSVGDYKVYLTADLVLLDSEGKATAPTFNTDVEHPVVKGEAPVTDPEIVGTYDYNGKAVTTAPTIDKVGNYLLLVKFKEGANDETEKFIYVPFKVGTTEGINRELIWFRGSWNPSVESGILYHHYTELGAIFGRMDLYDTVNGQVKHPDSWEGADAAAKAAAAWAAILANPAQYVHSWEAIYKSDFRYKYFPQINWRVKENVVGKFNLLVRYNVKDATGKVTATKEKWYGDDDLAGERFRTIPGTKKEVGNGFANTYSMISIPQLYAEDTYVTVPEGIEAFNNTGSMHYLNKDYQAAYAADGIPFKNGDGTQENVAENKVYAGNFPAEERDLHVNDALKANFIADDVELILVPADEQIQFTLTEKNVTLVFDEDDETVDHFTYDATSTENQIPDVVVTFNGVTLVENTDYQVIPPVEAVNANTYNITINGMGNYITDPENGIEMPYEIKAKLNDAEGWDLSADNVTYWGEDTYKKAINKAMLRKNGTIKSFSDDAVGEVAFVYIGENKAANDKLSEIDGEEVDNPNHVGWWLMRVYIPSATGGDNNNLYCVYDQFKVNPAILTLALTTIDMKYGQAYPDLGDPENAPENGKYSVPGDEESEGYKPGDSRDNVEIRNFGKAQPLASYGEFVEAGKNYFYLHTGSPKAVTMIDGKPYENYTVQVVNQQAMLRVTEGNIGVAIAETNMSKTYGFKDPEFNAVITNADNKYVKVYSGEEKVADCVAAYIADNYSEEEAAALTDVQKAAITAGVTRELTELQKIYGYVTVTRDGGVGSTPRKEDVGAYDFIITVDKAADDKYAKNYQWTPAVGAKFYIEPYDLAKSYKADGSVWDATKDKEADKIESKFQIIPTDLVYQGVAVVHEGEGTATLGTVEAGKKISVYFNHDVPEIGTFLLNDKATPDDASTTTVNEYKPADYAISAYANNVNVVREAITWLAKENATVTIKAHTPEADDNINGNIINSQDANFAIQPKLATISFGEYTKEYGTDDKDAWLNTDEHNPHQTVYDLGISIFNPKYEGLYEADLTKATTDNGSAFWITKPVFAREDGEDMGDYAIYCKKDGEKVIGTAQNYDFTAKAGKLTITKANLYVSAKPYILEEPTDEDADPIKVYYDTENANNPNNKKFVFGADIQFEVKVNGYKQPKGQLEPDKNLLGEDGLVPTPEGTYGTIKVSGLNTVEGFSWEFEGGDDELTNYFVHYIDGRGNIQAADGLFIYADNKTKTYGTLDPELTYTAKLDGKVLTAKELDALWLEGQTKKEIKLSRVNATIAKGSNVGNYAILFAESCPKQIGNYNVQYKEGTLTIQRATLFAKVAVVYAKDKDNKPVYDSSIAYGDVVGRYVDNKVPGYTIVENTNPVSTESGVAGSHEIAPVGSGLIEGDYFDQVVNEPLADLGGKSVLQTINYVCDYNDEPAVGKFTVSTEETTYEAKNYYVVVSPGVEVLNVDAAGLVLTARTQNYSYQTHFTDDEAKAYTTPSIKDEISDATIMITYNGETILEKDLPGGVKLTDLVSSVNCDITAAGNHKGAITLTKKDNDLIDATVVAGNLNITPLTVMHLSYENVAQALEDHKGFEMEKVYMPARQMKADQWYTFVLPFEFTVPEFARTFYYGVVDVLDEEKGDGDFHFNLTINDVEANQPFLFKVAENPKFPAADQGGYAVTREQMEEIYFEYKTIADVEEGGVFFAYNDLEKSPFRADKSGNKIIGQYTGIALKSLTDRDHYMVNGQFKVADPASTASLKPTVAYISSPSAEAAADVRIFVQEADGTTTDINAVDAEADAEFAEGWYTITGIKLDAKPTEKGVYIYNGKKVSIQ